MGKCSDYRHPEALAEGSFANTLCPPLVGDRNLRFRGGQLFERDSSVVTLPQNDCNAALDRDFSQTSFAQNDGGKSKESRHPEALAEGSLTKLDMDSSVVPLPQNDRKKKKVAFTLAEVLITLGIIGVVAAMTIPNLIANTRGQQYRTKFKKAISTLSQAGKMSTAQYDFSYGDINHSCVDGASDHPEEVMSICAILNGTLTGATYLGLASDYYTYGKMGIKNNDTVSIFMALALATKSAHAYQLADGSIFMFLDGNTGGDRGGCQVLEEGESSYCKGFIDVNGLSLPNKVVNCSSGRNGLPTSIEALYLRCIVKNDPQYLTDIYPVIIYDDTVQPGSLAAQYVFNSAR